MKVLVIGGGPAGMMAAIAAAEYGNDVTLLEKMSSCGKKLLITGKGRCNITNATDMENFYKNIPGNSRFLYSAFNNYTNQDMIDFLNKQGVKTKVERGERVFPTSDKSKDVLKAITSKMHELGVKIITNCKVTNILVDDGNVKGVRTEDGEKYFADKVILATGGITYKVTGSTGDGYKMAKEVGHTVADPKSALAPLDSYGSSLEICRNLQGLSLKNIKIKILADKKEIYEDFGEMLFTHFGVSGPVILSASSILLRYKNIEELLEKNLVKLQIDLKPALDRQKLDLRILRDFEEFKNKQFKNSLDKLLPQKLIPVFIEYTKIDPEKKINSITKEEREKIVNSLKSFEIDIFGITSKEEGIVTAGGINTKEINPKTMESKIIKGLYFAGEVIDIDALTRRI